jgi:cytochrome c553
MKKILVTTLSSLLLVAANVSFAAGDAAAGKAKSAVCAGCHGADGKSASPMFPNLAGQKDAYLVKQLKAFRDGTRSDPSMSPMAKPLTDADIDNLAAYYSSL